MRSRLKNGPRGYCKFPYIIYEFRVAFTLKYIEQLLTKLRLASIKKEFLIKSRNTFEFFCINLYYVDPLCGVLFIYFSQNI